MKRRSRLRAQWKRALHAPPAQALLARLVALYIRLVHHSSRSRYDIHPDARPYWTGEKQAIFVVWHGNMLMMAIHCLRCRPMRVLISHHRDGELIARAIGRFGYQALRGSSSKGGARMLASALRALREGVNLGITPDGPRGPARQAQEGTVFLARKSGLPVVPLSFASTRGRRMRSWDAFQVPLPFGRLRYIAGPPLLPQDSRELKQALDALEGGGLPSSAAWQ